MAEKGRPRKPTELKKAQGTFRKDRENQNRPEFKLITAVPDCPRYLTTPQSNAIWQDITSALIELGILQEVDLGMLAAYAQELGIYFWYQEDLDKKGRTYMSGQKLLPRPQVKIAQDALKNAQSIAARFGFTPADREKINVLLSMQQAKGDKPKPKKGEFSW